VPVGTVSTIFMCVCLWDGWDIANLLWSGGIWCCIIGSMEGKGGRDPSIFGCPNSDNYIGGRWPLLLGPWLCDVDIDISTGSISARNKYATMSTNPSTTASLPPLISLTGDLKSLHQRVAKPTAPDLSTVIAIANGKSDFIYFTVKSFTFIPHSIVYGLQNEWKSKE